MRLGERTKQNGTLGYSTGLSCNPMKPRDALKSLFVRHLGHPFDGEAALLKRRVISIPVGA